MRPWDERFSGFEPGHQHGYFVPMVDMLAGVVFLLVILLVANAHISRPEFQAEAAARREIARIEAELAAARAMERNVVEPRRQAERAAQILLGRMQGALLEAGIRSIVLANERRLVVPDVALWRDRQFHPSPQAEELAAAIGRILASDLSCLAPKPLGEVPATCSDYPPAKLDRLGLGIRPGSRGAGEPQSADAQSLLLLTEVVRPYPLLPALRAPDGEALVGYGALAAVPDGPRGDAVEVQLQFDLPPVP